MELELRKSLKHNLIVNLLDGGFFGLALGLTSFVTIIPLFVSTMTDSAILIGLIPAIHNMGWQLPQLLVANRVAHQKRFKTMTLIMTIQERLPYIGLALVAFFLPRIGHRWGLILTFGLLIWQGLGSGLTANPWQSMIGKIIPSDRRGTFFGVQSAGANLLASLGAVIAGFVLEKLPSPLDFSALFGISVISLTVSWGFLASTREPESPPIEPVSSSTFWSRIAVILRSDMNFRWFLAARSLSQVAVMGFAFYAVYAVQGLGMSEMGAGVLTSLYLGAQIAANPLMGWVGDRYSHRLVMEIGLGAAALSGLIAWWAPIPEWFYLVFVLAGVANVAVTTLGVAMTLEFGHENDRPAYIGLANTLIVPFTILAPFLGGWLADQAGYPAAFIASVGGSLATLGVLQFWVRDPRQLTPRLSDPIPDLSQSAEPPQLEPPPQSPS